MVADLLRVVVLLLGGFAFGLSAIVLRLYVRLPDQHHVPAYFVPLITVSHMLMVLAIEGAIVQHVIQRESFEWWLSPLAGVAFCLSIAATVEMLRSRHLRELANHR